MYLFDELIDEAYEQEAKIITAMIEQSREGNEIRLLGKGNSMSPLLRDGRDYAYLNAITDFSKLRRGDILLYFYKGHYVLHRIHHISDGYYYMLGDGNYSIEPPLEQSKICLKATKIEHNGKVIPLNRWYLRLYGEIWLLLRKKRPAIRYHVNKIKKKGSTSI